MSESLVNINNYLSYLELEKRYSKHTIISYKRDLQDFKEFIDEFYQLPMNQIELTHVRSYMVSLLEKELAKTSVSRKISSVKSFFKYLLNFFFCRVFDTYLFSNSFHYFFKGFY